MAIFNKQTQAQLEELARLELNTLLTGPHGVGKTTFFHDLCAKLGWKGAYINCPLTDFFVDWMGIPSPDLEPEPVRVMRWFVNKGADHLAANFARTNLLMEPALASQTVDFIKAMPSQSTLEFLRPKRLDGVQFVFFDELNRSTDPRFLDSCMEMIQFKTLNGQALPNLRLVWAAQNPANSIYKVKELDVPLIDKFAAHVLIEGNPDFEYYVSKGYNSETVGAVLNWYNTDTRKENKGRLSPRTIENVIRLADKGVDLEFALLSSLGIAAHMLKAKLAKCATGDKYATLDLATIATDPLRCMDLAKADMDFNAHFTDLLLKNAVPADSILRTIPVFMSMPYEFQNKCLTDVNFMKKVGPRLKENLPDAIGTIPNLEVFRELVRQSAGDF